MSVRATKWLDYALAVAIAVSLAAAMVFWSVCEGC